MNCLVSKGNINYETVGSGFPILILHGMGTDHRSMQAWIEPTFNNVEDVQRIYIDLPAHGHSLIDENLKSSDDILLNLIDFIDKTLPNQEFSLIGFSYGGYLAQGILHQKRKYVKSICLIAPALHLKERNRPTKVVFQKDEGVLSRLDPEIRTAFETLFNYQSKENLEFFLNEIQPGRQLANRDFLMSNWRENGYYFSNQPFQDVETMSQQALIILGKQDSICGYKDHFFLLDKFPNATFTILDQAGHMLQIEKREVVQTLLKDWLFRMQSKDE